MLTVTLRVGGGIVFLQAGYCGVQMVVWTTVGVIGRHCWLSGCGCALLCHSWYQFNYWQQARYGLQNSINCTPGSLSEKLYCRCTEPDVQKQLHRADCSRTLQKRRYISCYRTGHWPMLLIYRQCLTSADHPAACSHLNLIFLNAFLPSFSFSQFLFGVFRKSSFA